MDKLQLLNDHQLPFAKVLGLKFIGRERDGREGRDGRQARTLHPARHTAWWRRDGLRRHAGRRRHHPEPARGQGHDHDREQDQLRGARAGRHHGAGRDDADPSRPAYHGVADAGSPPPRASWWPSSPRRRWCCSRQPQCSRAGMKAWRAASASAVLCCASLPPVDADLEKCSRIAGQQELAVDARVRLGQGTVGDAPEGHAAVGAGRRHRRPLEIGCSRST